MRASVAHPLVLLVFVAVAAPLLAAQPAEAAQTETVKLFYFGTRGRAEIVRSYLEYLGLEYTDHRFEGTEWQDTYKRSGAFAFEQVPGLEWCAADGKDCITLVQSHTILRFLARKYDAEAYSDDVAHWVDLADDGVEDWRGKYGKLVYGSYDNTDAMRAAIAEYADDVIPLWRGHFERLLSPDGVIRRGTASPVAKDAPFIAGSKITHADISVFTVLHLNWRLIGDALWTDAPQLRRLYDAVAAHPNMAAYFASGRRPAWPNGLSASIDNEENPAPFLDADSAKANSEL